MQQKDPHGWQGQSPVEGPVEGQVQCQVDCQLVAAAVGPHAHANILVCAARLS